MKFFQSIIRAVIITFLLYSCNGSQDANKEMIRLLASVAKSQYTMTNAFCPEAKLAFYDSILSNTQNRSKAGAAFYYKAVTLLELGKEPESVSLFEQLLANSVNTDADSKEMLQKSLGIAYLRLGERTNCLHNHTAQSCLFPIQQAGFHTDKSGSANATRIYEILLKAKPDDLESRWLLNIAYMTIGGYPQDVPPQYLIKGLGEDTASAYIQPFQDMAVNTGLSTTNPAGGSIVDDFNNDNYLDIITSSWSLSEAMHYSRNDGKGSFINLSDSSGISAFTGGLNIMQTDYNNDGFKDIFVLRGGWKGPFGKEPNSLLRNNGNGTFTDVTIESGLLSFHPTQTATWNDFNRDGWLDVFIGNESTSMNDENECELYINNKDGTFTQTALKSKVNIVAFVKGVTSGDYDNDGWPDIFVSTLGPEKMLFRNEGVKDGVVQFKNVAREAGLGSCTTKTFPTCFFDYDNDGWLDILLCSYEFNGPLASYAAAEALGMNPGNSAKQFLFRNKHDGTFEDVTDKVGLNKIAFTMGMNFGDIDNDGYLDLYFGTGNPLYQSLVPNKMFKNVQGRYFMDVTASARVGNLQKGHGVSFADLDNDGDVDIHIEMGGAYSGDAYQNSLYINPGQNANNWINLQLEGTTSNKAAIGAKIKITFSENGTQRFIYRDVNSGGSFGSNPLMQHIGLGKSNVVEEIEIVWPAKSNKQVFKNIRPNQSIRLQEGSDTFLPIKTRTIDFSHTTGGLVSCGPRSMIANN